MFEWFKQIYAYLGWKEIASLLFVTGLLSMGLFSLIGHILMIRISVVTTYIGLFWIYKVSFNMTK